MMTARVSRMLACCVLAATGAFVQTASGASHVLQYDYADTLCVFYPVLVSRDGHVVSSYYSGTTPHVLTTGIGQTSTDYTLPANMRMICPTVSNWGFALTFDHGGYVPIEYSAARFGSDLQRVSSGYAGSSPSINDNGIVSYYSWQTSIYSDYQTTLYQWQPGTTPAALPDPPNLDDNHGGYKSCPAVSTAGVVSVFYNGRFGHYSPTDGWTSQTFYDPLTGYQVGFLGPNTRELPSGAIAFQGRYTFSNPTLEIHDCIYLYDGKDLIRVTESTGFGTYGYDRSVYLTLADDGSLLTLGGGGFGITPYASLRKANGTTVALQSLLPAGQKLGSLVNCVMNDAGDVAFEGYNATAKTYSYYLYDGINTYTLLDGLSTRISNPFLGDDGSMYYYAREASGRYSLYYTDSVPEPSSLLLLAASAGALLIRRRSHAVLR